MISSLFKSHSLKTRIALATLAIFIGGLWSLSFYASRMLRKDMEHVLGEQQYSTVSVIADHINTELDDRLKALEMVANGSASALREGPATMRSHLEQRPVLQMLFNGGLIAYGLDGMEIADFPATQGRKGVSDLSIEVVAAALQDGKSTIGRPVHTKQLRSAVFGMGAPIRDAAGRVIGCLVGLVNLGIPNFLDHLTENRYGKSGYYLLEEPKDRLIVTGTDKQRIMERLPPPGVNALVDRHVQGFDEVGVTVNPHGQEVLASARRVPVAGWFLVAALPTDEAFAPIRAMQRRMLLTTLLLTLLAGGLTWWMLRRQLSPMLTTVQTLAAMSASSEALQPLPVTSQDEIGQLVGGFNRLLEILGQRKTALKESESLLRESQSAAGLGSYALDVSSGLWKSSDVCDKVFGIDNACERSVAGWTALIHPDDRAMMTDYFTNEVLGRGQAFDKTYRIIRHVDGAERWVHGLGQLELDAAGRPLTMRGTIQDVTARKQAEIALKASEQRFRDLVNSTDGIVWEADAATFTFTFVSAQAERLLGFPLADWLQPGFWVEHLHHEDKLWAPEYCAACTGRMEPHDFEYRFITKSGDTVWLRDIVTVVTENDRPRWLRGLMVNITQRKQMEKVLRASEARYRSVTQTANDAIITADSNGNIANWNRGAETIFGYTEAEALGMPLARLMPNRYRDGHARGFAHWLAHGMSDAQGRTMELKGLRKGGREFPLELSLATWETEEGRFITGIIRDISARKQTEDSLRIAATAFESQEAMTITDANNIILKVNRSFTRITGYSEEEVIGRTPALLKSGRQDNAFYQAMWQSINRDNYWQGEIWNRRKSGEIYPERLAISAVLDREGKVTNYVGAFSDISLHKEAEDRIQVLAFTDPLTGLPNRRLLMDRLQQALSASARSKRQGALMLIDLDNFKTLNDTLGHDKGDLLLKDVAQRLVYCVREGDTVARLGGDEFVVMLEGLSQSPDAGATQTEGVSEQIFRSLNQPYLLADLECRSTPSIGVTLFADGEGSVDELLKQAELAMYRAKEAGRNTLRFFDPEMQAAVSLRAALEADLRLAVRQNQFLLHYQPQVDASGRLTGAEALVRWQHPSRGLVSPAEFIPLTEETGLIVPLGHWVLQTACEQLVAWAARPDTKHLTLAVNVSARQFRLPDFVDQVLAVLDHTGADPQRLKLELTESVLVVEVEDTIAKMTALKSRGVSFSLDDFGTGYSSLSYLKRLPLDQLKIDQSFVRDVMTDANDATIARTVLALGQSLGLAVIAEGVETEAQRDFLASHGCLAYQGYFFSRPLPLAAFEEFARIR